MDENKNPIKNRLSDQLPSHSPDPGSWQRLSAQLEAIDADAAFRQKLDNLPLHKPAPGTWNSILFRLNRAAYVKTGVRVALSAAAGLLLFFSVSRISGTYFETPVAPTLTEQVTPVNSPTVSPLKEAKASNKADIQHTIGNSNLLIAGNAAISSGHTAPSILPDKIQIADLPSEVELYPIIDVPVPDQAVVELAAGNASGASDLIPEEVTPYSGSLPSTSVLFEKQSTIPVSPPVKYYTPKEPSSGSRNNFALAMNYLPENIDNGTDMSLFHNVDLTASYNKEKVRFNTSLGMAYNEEQLVFEMNYNINTPVMGVGPSGDMDTVGYEVARLESQYQGTEKHQYFIYNLGFGRKLFSIGNLSSWISAGAGFGLKLNDPDIIASTAKNIKNQYNAQITSVDSQSQPVYNDVNVNFVTGIDFNYKLFNRLSITFTPTSRWYFKPVLTINNQPTDELTLGFKTGMKFEF